MLKSFAAMARFARNRPNDQFHLTGTWIHYKKQRRRRQLGLGKAVVWGTTIVAFCCLWLPIVSGIDERVHLLKLYETTNGPAWKRSAHWNSNDSVCSWFGITCETIDDVDVVTRIELHRNNLNGKVPPELWKLPHLKHIDMRNNLLTSASFEGLKASDDSSTSPIEVILLSDNHLTNLNGIGNAKATLRELNANQNQIDDNIGIVFDCTNLELLHFSFNQISGTLPTLIGMLTKLTEFYASDNRISGQLPKEIGMLNVCQVFALGNNLLSGTLPAELDNMVNMRELSLHKNTGITGSLLSLGDMPYLELLTLEGNSLSGSIPSDFLRHNKNIPKPVTIDLSHNNITGTLPKSLERFETLSIDLVGNMIEEIPTELCEKGGWMGGLVEQFGCDAILCGKGTYNREGRADDIGDCIPCKDNYPYLGATACSSATQEPWEVLADFYEGMSGYKWTTNDGWDIFADTSVNVSNSEICDTFYGVGCDGDQISNISLPDNELFGAVPDCIFSLPSLQILDLSNNNIQLTDMRGAERAHALKSLKLSNVKIKSLDGIGNLTSLEELYLDGLSIVEPLHYELFRLTKLKTLDLQHSKFEGALPPLVGQLSLLERLNVYGNFLTGYLPTELGALVFLASLDLSENGFHGTLPTELMLLTGLTSLVIHQTNGELEGKLPAFDNFTQLVELNLASNRFNGIIPDGFLAAVSDKSAVITISLENNNLTGTIPESLGNFDRLFLELEGNLISAIPSSLCGKVDWMNGEIGKLAEDSRCNGILCPPGTWNEFGKETITRSCKTCSVSEFYGQTKCGVLEKTREQEILDLLFSRTGGRYWTRAHNNWTKPGVPICQREGIMCLGDEHDNEGVRVIHMNGFGIRGTLPSEIWELSHLQELAFTNNPVDVSFTGIENATKLEGLKLSRCHLRSLDGLENAHSVRELHIAQNQFEGLIPDRLFELDKLEKVFLNNNHFAGSLPSDIGRLSALKVLDLWNNRLSGVLPSEIGLLYDLSQLKLSENHLSGAIPAELLGLPNLLSFEIARQLGNKFAGPLPAFDENPFLRKLDASENAFTGVLPQSFLSQTNTSQKIIVDLSQNQFSGSIPERWSSFESLDINLSGNMLTGIPDSLCKQGGWNGGSVGLVGTCDAILCPPGTYLELGRQAVATEICQDCPGGLESAPFYGSRECLNPMLTTEREILTEFYIAANGMSWLTQTGWLSNDPTCSWYGVKCNEERFVEEISLENNYLKSTSPFGVSKLFALSELKTLDLKGNAVELDFEKIPPNSKLQVLRLSGTGLQSIDGISRATELRELHVTNNEIVEIPEEVYDLAKLQSLFVSFNSITGTISPKISKLSSLKQLYLFGNHITGTLPPAIALMTSLTDFVAGKNFLRGTIPGEIGALPMLEQLSLLDQDGVELITGPLPSFSGAPKLWYFDASNNDLTGPIPDNFLINSANTNASVAIYLQNNELTGTVPSELERFEFLDIDLAGNRIEWIPEDLCKIDGWMQGNSKFVGNCSAILCPKGTFNQFGHQTPESRCLPCSHLDDTAYLGNTNCEEFSSERETLSQLFAATGGEFWKENESWQSDAPICSWSRIRCEDGDLQDNQGITTIQLDENDLFGTLPSVVWTLPALRHFSASGNPNLNVDLIDLVRAADTLEALRLSNVHILALDGISGASSLRFLHISDNLLKGTFPAELFRLSNTLESLYMSQNLFFGTLPTMVGRLTNLKTFDAFSNDFLSTMPTELGALKDLEALVLSDNILYGTIPSELSSMPALQSFAAFRIHKSGPRLSGSLPSFNKSPQLTHLLLQGNELQGAIPSDFVSASKSIQTISLSSNLLTGNVPEALASIPSLALELDGNQIGDFPIAFCKPKNDMDGTVGTLGCAGFLCPPGTANPKGRALNSSSPCTNCTELDQRAFYGATSCAPSQREILMDFFHSLDGKSWYRDDFWGSTADVCNWYGIGCSEGQVIEINLRGNNLVGVPNPDLFYLRELKILWLYSNPMSFSFENIGSAKKLEDLRLDSTRLHSLRGVGAATSLISFDARFTKVRGQFPEEILGLTNLRHLSLGNNGITGSLPQSFADLKFLASLSLDSNLVSGKLPAFDDMHFLKYLDLSDNELTGSISKDLFTLLSANTEPSVALSNNLLTGVVPEEIGRFDRLTIYLTGNSILGLPLTLCYNDIWNDGDVGDYWCDGIMCKPGTYNDYGRKTRYEPFCKPCGSAVYFGSTTCSAEISGTQSLVSPAPFLILVLLFLLD